MPGVNRVSCLDEAGKLRAGVLILNGPSGSGKGTVADALLERFSIPKTHHLSMGEILRSTIQRAKSDGEFCATLLNRHNIGMDNNIFESEDSCPELVAEIEQHLPPMERFFHKRNMRQRTSSLEWLEYCTLNGLLVPNRWTQEFIAAYMRNCLSTGFRSFLLDGYPRRLDAAKHLLDFLEEENLPVLRVFHIFIGKYEMMRRARLRGRADDDERSLRSRYEFFLDSVQPTMDYLKECLGNDCCVLIDGHQPVFQQTSEGRELDFQASVGRVVADVMAVTVS